jgi:hypothetical protein
MTCQKNIEYKNAPHIRAGRCDLGRIQTCNHLIRSQVLYSVELRGHFEKPIYKRARIDN